MLSSVAHFLKLIIYYGFAASYGTGRFIVAAANAVIKGICELYVNFVILFKIVAEDFSYFLKDVLAGVQILVYIVGGLLSSIYGLFASIFANVLLGVDMILSSVSGLINVVTSIFEAILSSVQGAVVVVKKLIVLFGSGVWFALSIIPLCIFYTFTTVTYYVGSVINEAAVLVFYVFNSFYKCGIDVFNFVTDVPLESFLGTCAALCIIYVLIHYQVILVMYISQRANVFITGICSSLERCFAYLKRTIRNLFRRNSDEDIVIGRVNFEDEDVNNQLCVVCHERLKCILMLPCRHVCLCRHCAARLKATNNTCPLCRRHIEKTMKVFV